MVSQLVVLTVLIPQAIIPGNGEYHVDTGSTISLSCYIDQSTIPPQFIFWYHNSRMINYDQQRGGINVEIDMEPRVRSRLTISDARPSDSGNYTCDAENTGPASITVYITQGNKIAAIQPRDLNGASRLEICCSTSAISMFFVLLNAFQDQTVLSRAMNCCFMIPFSIEMLFELAINIFLMV